MHPGLNSYSKLEDHYHIEHKNKFSGQGTTVYQQLKGGNGNVFPDFAELNAKWDTAAEYIAVYPNVLLGVHRDHAFVIILIPDGPEKTYEHIHLFYSKENTPKQLRLQNMKQWKLVFEEDVPVVEVMQRGRHAVNFDGGRFSPVMDNPTHCFHCWVANEVELYAKAAYTTSNINKACFFMVNAYTLALECNHPDTLSFFQFLQKYDREK